MRTTHVDPTTPRGIKAETRAIVLTPDTYRELYRPCTPYLREKLALFHEALDEASARRYMTCVWLPVYDWSYESVLFAPVEDHRGATVGDWSFFHALAEECGLYSWKSHPGRVSDRSPNYERKGNPED